MSQAQEQASAQMRDFFISYTQPDRVWAEWIAWQLERAGYRVTLQAWDFRPGQNFALEMDEAARNSERTLIVLSPDFLKSRYAAAEWARAFASDPTGQSGALLPVRVRRCEPTGLLGAIAYIDLVGMKKDAARETLLAGVSLDRAKPTVAPDFPSPTIEHTADRPERFPGRGSVNRLFYVVGTSKVGLAAALVIGGGAITSIAAYRAVSNGAKQTAAAAAPALNATPDPWDATDMVAAFLKIDRQLRTFVDRARDLKDTLTSSLPVAFTDATSHARLNAAIHGYNSVRERIQQDRVQYFQAIKRRASARSVVPARLDALLDQIEDFHQRIVLPLNDLTRTMNELAARTDRQADGERDRARGRMTALLDRMRDELNRIDQALRALEKDINRNL